MKTGSLFARIYRWRIRHLPDREFILILSFIIGVLSGLAAVIIKNLVRLIQGFLEGSAFLETQPVFRILLPVAGILLVTMIVRYLVRQHVGHGIPLVLYAISRNNGRIKSHNLYSSIITSALTVGFGGSVGLEGPTVATGAAIGSTVSRMWRLDYKHVLMMLGAASAGAMSAIFKAPIAGIAFALEVIMLQFTTASVLPLLVASVSGALTAYFFLGQSTLITIKEVSAFEFAHLPYYILLGIVTGFIALYFTRIYMFLWGFFERITDQWKKFLLGALVLAFLVWIFPSLYGEGYHDINNALQGDYQYVFENTWYEHLSNSLPGLAIVLLLIVFTKAIATTVTFAAGGIGGIFAPTLFMGVNTGIAFVVFCQLLGIDLPAGNFALVGMGGMIAAVIQAPLTAIFLIAEITSGYALFMPLMITVTVSWIVFRIFETNSIYTYQLARRGALFTHDQDKTVLSLMKVKDLIETNFDPVKPDDTLGELVEVISHSQRNIFPVLDDEGNMLGVVWVNDIRHIIFKPEMYDKIKVRDLMFMPQPNVSPEESMEDVAKKFQNSSHYNLPVMRDGKYVGFVSRANVFSRYRQMIKHFSED